MSGYKVEICGVNTARLPLLTNEEKEALFERILAGDKEAREEYIKGNLRLVLSVIQRFSASSVPFSAMIWCAPNTRSAVDSPSPALA